jgi:hypothetical protein
MNRRTFNTLAGFGMLGALRRGVESQIPGSSDSTGRQMLGPEVILEDDQLLVAFDEQSGAITRLTRKSTGWTIQRRPELGVSFRMLAPMPHQRSNFIFGHKQKAQRVERISEHEVHLEWNNLLSDHAGILPIRFTVSATLKSGQLEFNANIENRSTLVVETVDYPYFGDLNAPSPAEQMSSEHMWYGNLVGVELHPRFSNEKGYWGVDYPTKTVDSKQSLFCALQAASQGIYIEMADPSLPYLLQFTFEQRPGVQASTNDMVPTGDEISGFPIHLECRLCHFLFVAAGESRKFAPVVFKTYDGDWHKCIEIYKERRALWFKQPRLPAWVKEVHSWLQLQIDGAEQDFRIPYRDLPKYIDDCVANGVIAIQLVGWNIGGQDGGDPSQDTDPGLGTWEELKHAVGYANSKGIKMIMFGKIWWADLTTELYKKELYKYAATDPFGLEYQTGGFSYTTPTQLAGINNRRRAIMDVQCQAYRDFATREFEKILKFGAAGWLFDEVCHHGPVEYSFSKTHGYAAPKFIYGGDIPLSAQFRAAADKVDPDFVFAGEGPQDWLLQYYPISYFRIDNNSRPVCRLLDPQAPLVVAVTGLDDREKLNLIFLNRYIISYEPFNFKGHLTDFPLTLAYGQKIDALRRRYKAQLWDAEFRDSFGASVKATGLYRYSVFVQPNGKRAVVVINTEPQKSITVTVDVPNAGKLVTATPEDPEEKKLTGQINIPARSATVFMEA